MQLETFLVSKLENFRKKKLKQEHFYENLYCGFEAEAKLISSVYWNAVDSLLFYIRHEWQFLSLLCGWNGWLDFLSNSKNNFWFLSHFFGNIWIFSLVEGEKIRILSHFPSKVRIFCPRIHFLIFVVVSKMENTFQSEWQ